MAPQFGGIIDDARTLLKWRPILPLLKEWEDARDTTVKFRAGIKVLQFIVDAVESGPRAEKMVRAADRICAAMAVDASLREAIEDILR
jgi:hypothetical protein